MITTQHYLLHYLISIRIVFNTNITPFDTIFYSRAAIKQYNIDNSTSFSITHIRCLWAVNSSPGYTLHQLYVIDRLIASSTIFRRFVTFLVQEEYLEGIGDYLYITPKGLALLDAYISTLERVIERKRVEAIQRTKNIMIRRRAKEWKQRNR